MGSCTIRTFPYDEDFNPEGDSDEVLNTLKERKAYLAKLETQELLEVERAARFLVNVFRSSSSEEGVFPSTESKFSILKFGLIFG